MTYYCISIFDVKLLQFTKVLYQNHNNRQGNFIQELKLHCSEILPYRCIRNFVRYFIRCNTELRRTLLQHILRLRQTCLRLRSKGDIRPEIATYHKRDARSTLPS